MRTIFKTEFYKLSRSKSLWILMFFSFALLIIYIQQSGFLAMDIQFWAESNFFQMAFMLVAFYGIVIAHEYISGYFMEAVSGGYRRWEIYLARYFAFLLGTILITLMPCLLGILFSFLRVGTKNALPMVKTGYFAVGFGFFALYCICISSFFMMLIIITKTYSMVVFICIFYNMAIIMIQEIIPAAMLPQWIACSFLGIRQSLFFQTMEAREGTLLLFSLLGQSLLYTGIGIYYFAKIELR